MNTMHKNNKTISRQLKSAFAAWAAGLYIIGTGATAYALPEGGQVAAGPLSTGRTSALAAGKLSISISPTVRPCC